MMSIYIEMIFAKNSRSLFDTKSTKSDGNFNLYTLSDYNEKFSSPYGQDSLR